jgi:hypothetical protein
MSTPLQLVRERARGLGTSLSLAYRFRQELYPHWRRLVVALVCSIGYTLMRLAEPWPLKFVFDHVLESLPLQTPLPWVDQIFNGNPMLILDVSSGAILGLAAFRGVFYYFQNVFISSVGRRSCWACAGGSLLTCSASRCDSTMKAAPGTSSPGSPVISTCCARC